MDSSDIRPAKKMRTDKEQCFQKYCKDSLCYEYGKLFTDCDGWSYFRRLENELTYLKKEETTIEIYGKKHTVPRQLVAYGDEGISYTFSGSCIAAKPWSPLLLEIKGEVERIIDARFNFVLVNRYKDGKDCIGAHKDNEKDLDHNAPIASVSFGQKRQFVFSRKNYNSLKIVLENGSLLLMIYPTNKFWLHSLPRGNALCPRINLTFRKIIV